MPSEALAKEGYRMRYEAENLFATHIALQRRSPPSIRILSRQSVAARTFCRDNMRLKFAALSIPYRAAHLQSGGSQENPDKPERRKCSANGAHRGPSDIARRRPVLTSLDEHDGFQ